MSHVLSAGPNCLYIIEGHIYSYESEEYLFVMSMKRTLNSDNLMDDMFEMKVDMQDPLYDKKETLHPLERVKEKEGFRSNFVGALYDQTDKILISLPKYTQEIINIDAEQEAKEKAHEYWEELKFLMEKFQDKLAQRDPLFYTCTDAKYCELALARALFNWYAEHDLYNQTTPAYSQTIGRTLWGATVNRKTADIIKNTPLYRNVIKKRYVAQQDSITQLQMAVLNYLYIDKGYCEKFKYVSNSPVFNTFDVIDTDINIEEILQDEAQKQCWVNKLQYEKQMNFRDDYNDLFNLLLAFLNKEHLSDAQEQGLYGLCKFDNFFEVILSEYFGNQFSPKKLSDGKVETTLTSKFLKRTISDINQDYYNEAHYNILVKRKNIYRKYEYIKHDKTDNHGLLIPDIIFEIECNDKKYVVLIDAKYYNYHKNDAKLEVSNFPENYDVTKQYYYAKILETIYKKYGTNVSIVNMFIMPWRKDYKTGTKQWGHIGRVEFDEHNVQLLIVNFDTIITELKDNTQDIDTRRKKLLASISQE